MSRTLLSVSGQLVKHRFTTEADVADTFPLSVPCAVPPGERWASGVTGVLVVNCVAPGEDPPVDPVQVLEWSWADDVLTINNISGLLEEITYDISLLCLSMEAVGT